jgi:hypothetical protein
LSNGLKFTKVGGVSLLVGYQPQNNYQSTSINNQEINQDINQAINQDINYRHTLDHVGKPDDELLPIVGNVIFRITDTGVGIDPQEFTLLFQPFSQTSSGQQIQEGTGLGLHLSQQFVHLLGGEMTVCSQLDQGSTFKFNLPHFSRVLSATNSPIPPFDCSDSLDNSLDNSLNNLSNNLVSDSLADPSTNSSTHSSDALPEKPLSNSELNKANNANHHPLKRVASNDNIDYSNGDFSTLNILGNVPSFNYSLPDLVSENMPPLSSNWLLDFQRSIIQGDIIVIRSLTQEIALSHPLLYQTINHLTDEYKLEQLLDLAQALDSYVK